jgi:hypothetical protein
MSRRWVCPLCGHGKIAPARPRRLDVRVWCLRCSQRTGQLVHRVAPAAQRRAEERAERRRERRQRTEERLEVCRTSFPGCLHDYARRWSRLAAWEGADLRDVAIKVRQGSKAYVTGRAWIRGCGAPRLCVTVGVAPEGFGYEVLLHELAHHAGSRRLGPARIAGHGPAFWRLLARAVEEVLGRSVAWPPGPLGRGVNKQAKDEFQREVDAGRLPGRTKD